MLHVLLHHNHNRKENFTYIPSFCTLTYCITIARSATSMVRRRLLSLLLLTVAIPIFASARNFLLVLEDEDSIAAEDDGFSAESSLSSSSIITEDSDSGDWDDDEKIKIAETGLSAEQESWKLIEEEVIQDNTSVIHSLFSNGLKAMIRSASEGNPNLIKESIEDLQLSANGGNPHAQSALGFLHGAGIGVEKRDAHAFLYHYFAAQGGSYQSKMVMAYNYFRQQMYEESVKLYAEVASVAIASLFSSKESPLVEPIRIYDGTEENTEGLRKCRGEDDDDFQIIEYQAQKGNAGAMAKLGVFYYFGLRGVQRDHSKALYWFLKAAEKGQYECMEFIGEIYAGGIGVEKNYTRALAWFKGAVKRKQYSAYNGIGYLYAKGHGVEKKNFTRARECFKRAADSGDPNGHYNLGVVYLKGLGVKRDVRFACKRFVHAANNGQPKAFYQLANMFQKGIGVKRDLASSAFLYKLVAERGPWGSMLRWALECYLKGQIGKALLLYSRAAELGYEISQSNAAWILDKYGEYDICIGKSGFCDIEERHQRSHAFWWRASEQGNEHAALLIGDAYYYGRGTERDFERAAEAYLHAHSQANAQAMFNLGYMYEHGEGLPHDLHLAKRYYDQALETDPSAKLPVTFALFSLWLRKNYADTFMVKTLDSLPEFFSNFGVWLRDEGNLTLVALFVCLSTVLYLRQRHRNNFTQVTEQAEVVDN